MLTCGCAVINGFWSRCKTHALEPSLDLQAENAKLRAEVDALGLKMLTEISAKTAAKADLKVAQLQFEEARKIIVEVSYSPEFKKWFYHGKEQDPCGVHAFTAKYAEKPKCDANVADSVGCTLNAGHAGFHALGVKSTSNRVDTCENLKQDGVVQSRFCSTFEDHGTHVPTCQFSEKRNDVVPPTEAVGGAGRCTCGSKSFMKALHGVGCPVRD